MSRQLMRKLNRVFPPFLPSGKKGDNGRIGVVGGSFQFTGAPFYSAISALKVGADLSHIFCSKSSSASIKSYSPEIITHPVFISDEEISLGERDVKKMTQEWLQKIQAWNKAITAWVIGPGLGRDSYMLQFFPLLIHNLPSNSLVVFDAEGIFYLCQYPYLFKQLRKHRTILTPNWKQLKLLQNHIDIDLEQIMKMHNHANKDEVVEINLNNNKFGFSMIIKGQKDIIIGKKSFIVKTEGGMKRCGGLGDILAGVTATFSLWDQEYGGALACKVVRMATRQGFKKQGRGLTAPCVIRQLSGIVSLLSHQL